MTFCILQWVHKLTRLWWCDGDSAINLRNCNYRRKFQICSSEIRNYGLHSIFLLLKANIQYFLVTYGKKYFLVSYSKKDYHQRRYEYLWVHFIREIFKYVMTHLWYFMSFYKWVICPDKKFSCRKWTKSYIWILIIQARTTGKVIKHNNS